MVRYKIFWRDLEKITTYLDKDGQEVMRLTVTAFFMSLQEDAEEVLKPIKCGVDRYTDGSAAIDAACLVPWTLQQMEIDQIAERFAEVMTSVFGKKCENQLLDCVWTAGQADTRWDDLLTQEELSAIQDPEGFASRIPEQEELKIWDFAGKPVVLKPRVELYSVTDFMGTEMPGLALEFDAVDEESGSLVPYATLTKCFGEFISIKNSAYIDTNNCSFTDQLLEHGIADPTEYTKSSGYCTYPLWVFREGFLQKIGGEKYRIYAQAYDQYMCISSPEDTDVSDNGGESEQSGAEEAPEQEHRGG